ncbi:hypothetical protein EV401DRAFT_1914385 [Pisolithus croceorrhizus]|nr:hypothetical protein EV401DRAFT_1914385 [Pisolithus croceorrhizus]
MPFVKEVPDCIIVKFRAWHWCWCRNPFGHTFVSERTEKEVVPKNAQNWWLVLTTSTLIDVGFVMSIFIPFLLCRIFGRKHLNLVWSLSVGLGVILAFLWWWTLKWDDTWEYVCIPYCLAWKRYWKSLLGLSLVWNVTLTSKNELIINGGVMQGSFMTSSCTHLSYIPPQS